MLKQADPTVVGEGGIAVTEAVAPANITSPAPLPGVMSVPLDDELVLYAAETGQSHVLNVTAVQVWALCDGARTVEEIAQSIAARYETDAAVVLADVRECVAQLQQVHLLTA